MATLTVHGIDQSLNGRCFCHDLEVNDLTRQAIADAEHGNTASHTDAADLFRHLSDRTVQE